MSLTLQAKTEQNNFLIQSATDVDLKHLTGEQYQLIIHKPTEHIGYFTDRPVRKAGLISLKDYQMLWASKKVKNNFSQQAPNAAISMQLDKGKQQSFIVILGQPILKKGLMIYSLTKISAPAIETGHSRSLVMFVDSVHCNSGGF